MKTYKKNYIGKGRKLENYDIMKISFRLSDIMDLTHEYQGEQYLTFEVAKMMSPDKFGNQYTAYVSTIIESPEHSAVHEAPAKKSKKSKKQLPAEIPF